MRLVPTKIALTSGCSSRYSPNASFIGFEEVAKSSAYSFAEACTNESTSSKGCAGRIYTDLMLVGKIGKAFVAALEEAVVGASDVESFAEKCVCSAAR